ncbi:MAG: hypothetical protein PHG67_10235 [Bacteroidales bacterium]|jgi:hypothetical protein|nr:hypothetical protein [Bacteroidales bacterium]HOI32547.1 hypothetical protein [Bacteroidales bacterium]
MKTMTKLILLLAAVFMLSPGCEKAKELLDVKFEANFKSDLNIDVPAESKSATFNAEATIDPLSNSDFAEYGSKIKDIEIKGVKAVVTAINKSVVLENAEISVTSGSMTPAVWTYSDVTLAVGTELVMDNANNQWDNVQAILESLNPFTTAMSGTVSESGVQFTLQIEIKTSVTANPLD